MIPDLYENSVTELQAGLNGGHFTSTDLVKAYLARIEEVNVNGPALRAVIETNNFALAKASELDAERKLKPPRSTLHGIPVLLKDNIATLSSEGMNTTAGSLALQHSVVPDDAEVVKRLRAAGAIILGKTNLSEWAHYRGDIACGWSAVGGQTTSAYYEGGDPCGSSSGSAVAVSIGLSAVAIGTETNGSIVAPSSVNNIVGMKPTVGLTSRSGVVPLSSHQDSVGPMARCVTDAAIILNIIAGKDPNDKDTLSQPDTVPDFTKALNRRAFEGKRIGVPRHGFYSERRSSVDGDDQKRIDILDAFERAIEVIQTLGATIVDPADLPSIDEREANARRDEFFVLDTDFKVQLESYLSRLTANPSGVHNIADLIKFNDDHPDLEKPVGFEDQSRFIRSDARAGHDAAFFEALAANRDRGATRGIDAVLKEHNLDALVLPTQGLTSTVAAIAGYPIISVPLGFYSANVQIEKVGPNTVYPAPGVPFGLSFLGTAYSDFDLIGFAYAYEQKTKTRLARKAFKAAIPHTQLNDVMI